MQPTPIKPDPKSIFRRIRYDTHMIASIGKTLRHGILISMIMLVMIASNAGSVQAQSIQIGKYDFGGVSVSVFPCLNGLFVVGSPPKPGIFMFVPGISALKMWGPPKGPFYYMLGSHSQFFPCLIPCPTGICPIFWGQLVLPNSGSGLEPISPATAPAI